MTFNNLLLDVYRRTGYSASTSPAPDVITRIKGFVNEAQQELAGKPGLAGLLRGTTSLASVASTSSYALPPAVADVRKIYETTNDRALARKSLDWFRRNVPDPSAFSGTPYAYAMLGPQKVSAQPVATGVWIVSSSASDTAITASVEAVRTGGYPHTPGAATLNGTTRVQVGTQTDYVEVTDFYLSAAAVGDVTLYDAAASGNVLAVIPKGQTTSRYEWIALVPTPSAVVTYTIDYEKDISDLVNNTDEPSWLPVRFHRLLAIGARMREYEGKDDARYKTAQTEWIVGFKDLLSDVGGGSADGVLMPQSSGKSGRSDLGPNFPSSTIWD